MTEPTTRPANPPANPPAEPDEAELRGLLARPTLDDKLRLITGEDIWSLPAVPGIGLRKIVMSDGPVGVRGTSFDEGDASLLTPNPSAQAAAWDPELARRAGTLLGAQARDKGVHVLLAPTINMHRSPRGGRHFECYSEDPLLTARTAAGFIEGVQSAGVAATAKHFVANDSENQRRSYDVRADERTLREVYLAPFRAAVREARAWAVMSAYNSVNGHTMTENSPLQNGVLKDEWGFDGIVVSDWTAVMSTEPAALGGTDIAMPGPWALWGAPLREAVEAGRVAEADIDDKVLRILRLAARVGALDGTPPRPAPGIPADARTQLRAIAAQATVLLENRHEALPLNTGELRRVALIGPNAVRLSAQGGGSARCFPEHVVEVAEAMRTALGPDVELTVVDGAFTHRRPPALSPAIAAGPDSGKPGADIEYRAHDGTVLGTDHRRGAQVILWPGLFPKGTTSVALRTRVTPRTDGDHLLDVLGTGTLRLTVDGTGQTIELPSGTGDLGEALMRPPLRRVPVAARAGTPVDIEVVLGGDSEILIASLGLGWAEPRRDDDAELAAAVAAAAAADVAVVVVGTTDDIESEGFDRTDLALPGRSDELVSRVAAVNPATIVVVNAGAPVLMPWRHDVAAVVWAWLPGQEGGAAIADVLTGAAEPGGRLPTTFPAEESDVPVLDTTPVDGGHTYAEGPIVGHRLWALRGTRPAYPFGYGLGYTTWGYRDLRVDGDAARGLTIEAVVANVGARTGREVVQVYLEPAGGHLFGDPEPPRLAGYANVTAGAGNTVVARVTVTPDTLARWNPAERAWTVAPGRYRLHVGPNCADARLTAEIEL